MPKREEKKMIISSEITFRKSLTTMREMRKMILVSLCTLSFSLIVLLK